MSARRRDRGNSEGEEGGRGHPAGGVKPVQLLLAKLAGCSDLSAQLFTSLYLQGGFFLPALATSAPALDRTGQGPCHCQPCAQQAGTAPRRTAARASHSTARLHRRHHHPPLAALDHRVRSGLTGISHRRTVRARRTAHWDFPSPHSARTTDSPPAIMTSTATMAGRGIVRIRGGRFPAPFRPFQLPLRRPRPSHPSWAGLG